MLYEAVVMFMPGSMNFTKRSLLLSQNTVAISFLLKKVCLSFSTLEEFECFHCLDCAVIPFVSKQTHVLSLATVLFKKTIFSIMIALKKHQGNTYSLRFVRAGQHLGKPPHTELAKLQSPMVV